jgi:reactive intermediate/imine deaminase
MPDRSTISTDKAPAAIGPYSQAVAVGDTVYMSGQIPLDPATGETVSEDFVAQARQVFSNLGAVAEAAGGSFAEVVRLTVFLTDLGQFAKLNEIMVDYFSEPYPARAAVQVAALPRGVQIEIDAVMVLES